MRSQLFPFRKIGKFFSIIVIAGMIGLSMIAAVPNSAYWQMSGQARTNWRYQPMENIISNSNAATLMKKFAVPNNGGGDVSATPSVSDGTIYFPDWAGNLYSVNAVSGALNWSVKLSAMTGDAGTVSRSTPTVVGSSLIVGTLDQAKLLAVSRKDGHMLWETQLDDHSQAVLTQSPAYFNGTLFIGVASNEENAAANPSYPCCTFRGSLLAVDASTGKILWKTYTAPANGGVPGGYSGNAVWGSTPAVDSSRKLVYIGTGNNYTVPDSVAADPTTVDPTDYTDAILALDINTGKVVWADRLMGLGADAWNVACFFGGPNCPNPAGPDYDFGQGPMLITTMINGVSRDLVADGQKSGDFWALDADTGATVWKTTTGPGSTLGGMEWGSATDGKRIYVANAAGGFWEALDPASGAVIWKTLDPNPYDFAGVKDIAAVSVANGVVYAGSMGGNAGTALNNPTMFALDAATGKILWQFVSGASVASGPAIANGVVYWGTGYSRFGFGDGAGSSILYAFSVK